MEMGMFICCATAVLSCREKCCFPFFYTLWIILDGRYPSPCQQQAEIGDLSSFSNAPKG